MGIAFGPAANRQLKVSFGFSESCGEPSDLGPNPEPRVTSRRVILKEVVGGATNLEHQRTCVKANGRVSRVARPNAQVSPFQGFPQPPIFTQGKCALLGILGGAFQEFGLRQALLFRPMARA